MRRVDTKRLEDTLRLGERFLIFGIWLRHRRDPAASMKDRDAIANGYSSDRYAGVHAPVEPDKADRAAIDLSRRSLDFSDNFHRAYFGRPGDRAAGEASLQQRDGVVVCRERSGHD